MVDEFAPDPMIDGPHEPGETEDRPAVRLHPPTTLFFALIAGYVIRLFAGGRMPIPRAFAEGLGGLMIIIGIGTAIFSTSFRNVDYSLGIVTIGPITVPGTRFTSALLAR